MGLSTIPPPPTDSPDLTGAGSGGGMDRIRNLISKLSGGGTPMIDQKLAEHYAKRKTEADLAKQQLQSVANEYARAKTDEDRARIGAQWESAKERYTKIAGQSKEAKPIIQQTIGLIEHLIGHGKGKQGQPQEGGGGAQGAPSGPGPNARESTVPPPPSAGASAAPVKSTLPPPPDPEMEAMGAGTREAEFEHTRGQADADAASKRKIAEEQVRYRQRLHPVQISLPDGTRIPAVQNLDTGEVSADGKVIDNPQIIPTSTLPTTSSSTSQYNADTGTTTTTRTTKKGGAASGVGSSKGKGGRTSTVPAPPKSGGRLEAMSDDWDKGLVPSAKDRPQVEAWRKAQGKEGAPMPMLPAAQTIVVKTQPVLDQVDRLLGDIDRLGLGNNNTPGFLAKDRAKYSLGIASPEGSLGADIAGLSLGSVVEAASALQGATRSVSGLRMAMKHTPNAWVDSPKMLKEKLTTIKERLNDIVGDAYKYGKKGMSGPPGSGGGSSTKKMTDGGRTYNIPLNRVEEFKRDHPNAR